ncbi:RnfABCDGE type electron transport complex subunit D [bacterium]|nr:RnfABCDGE type electron transport complex subunit D [bacterium]
MTRLFTVSGSPHLRDRTTIPIIMFSVILSLLPALAGSIYFFGFRALVITVISVISCVAAEWIIGKLTGKQLTIRDGSAIVTGILLAFNLAAGVPWWIPVIGGVFAIGVGKMTFGGLGYNPLNPALLARVFLLLSWPVEMTTTWTAPRGMAVPDAVSVATPLGILKETMKVLKNSDMFSNNIDTIVNAGEKMADIQGSLMDLFIGRVPGCLGETSAMLLLVGAAFLLYKRYIGWRIPFSFIGSVALLSWIFGGYEGFFTGPWLFHILSGGVFLGAFFMATDMVTSPVTPMGRLIFGTGCGAITVIIRLIGGYPEGVSFSILLMNLTVPLIDRYTQPKVFGEVKARA